MNSSEAYLHDAIKQFSSRYRPRTDPDDAYEFDAALHGIMRAAFAEAVRPFVLELSVYRNNTLSASAARAATFGQI